MKELIQYREEFVEGNIPFITPESPHYHNHIKAMRHSATADDRTVAVCCHHSSTYQFIHVPVPELQTILSPTMTFEQFEQLIYANDRQHAVDARKRAYQFAQSITDSEIRNYMLAFECRIRFDKKPLLRTLLKYRIDISSADAQSQLLMLQLLPISIGEDEDISKGTRIVNINTREVVLSNKIDQLTRCELIVMRLVKKGLSSNEIAEKLCISPNTVNNHRRSVLNKTQMVNTDLAARYLEFVGIL